MRELQLIERILRETAAFLMGQYGHRDSLQVSSKKGAADLVTEADVEAQRRIELMIAAEFPSDIFVAEEVGKDQPPADAAARCWVCDPIDGTHNFARGMIAGWGISLAFVEAGKPRAAGVILPGLHELFLAREGGGATRNGAATRVSSLNDLAEARIEMDMGRPADRERCLAVGHHALHHGGQIRNHGSAVVGLCTVAAGTAEAYLHGGLQPWDFAAAMLIVREAGGRVTRLDGTDAEIFDDKRGMIASNTLLHGVLLAGAAAHMARNPTP